MDLDRIWTEKLEEHDGQFPSGKSTQADERKLAGWVNSQRKARKACRNKGV